MFAKTVGCSVHVGCNIIIAQKLAKQAKKKQQNDQHTHT